MFMAAATSSRSSAQTGSAMPQTNSVATPQPIVLRILSSPRADPLPDRTLEESTAARAQAEVKDRSQPSDQRRHPGNPPAVDAGNAGFAKRVQSSPTGG